MTLPTSGTITAKQIADTLGYTLGATGGTRIGDYRLDGGQTFVGGTPEQPTQITLPISNGIPITGPISFSDFYGARPTYIVDYYSGAAETPSDDAYERFKANNKVIIGGKIGPKDGDANDTSGRRVIILVNKDIGSDTRTATHCALKTGSGWSSDTQLEILVGPNGEILGAGGLGGGGGSGHSGGRDGNDGGSASSALGIQYEGTGRTRVIVQNLGRIAGGGGGGGGGGGARAEREESWSGPERGANGGAGGNGIGYNQDQSDGGEGGTSSIRALTVVGGDGGNGGNFGNAGGNGVDGSASGYLEWSSLGEGGAGGGAGAAIRKTNANINIEVSTQGALSQIAGATDALGIT